MNQQVVEDKESIRRRDQELAQSKALEAEALEKLRGEQRKKIQAKRKKRAQKSFWVRYEDYFGYGLIAFVVLFIMYANFSGDRRSPAKIQVNEDVYIQAQNDDNLLYTLKKNDFFEGTNMKTAQSLFNNLLTTENSQPICDAKPLANVKVPKNYNFYTAHPKCRFPTTQRQCSSAYAEAPLSVVRNRQCLKKKEDRSLSLDYLFNCDTPQNKGCKSGFLLNSLEFAKDNGYVDQKCWESLNIKEGQCPTAKQLEGCQRTELSSYCVLKGRKDIKREIVKNGPVLALIQPYRDFLIMDKGVFTFSGDKTALRGFQVVKIVGFGYENNEENTKYWLVENLWGEGWGENGLAKVEMGHEDSYLDKFAVTMYIK